MGGRFMKSSLCYILCATAVYAETPQRAYNAENFGGGYCGVGVSVGVKTTTADINSEFRNRSNSMSSAFYGGSANVGYQHRICGNCFVGIEMGVDLGSASKAKVGGVLKSDSYYIQSTYAKRELLRQILLESSYAFDTRRGADSALLRVVDSGVWNSFVSVLRYIGGANIDVSNPHLRQFITSPAHAGGIFNPPNANATLRNFMGRAMDRITEAGRLEISSINADQNLYRGLAIMREFVTTRYPLYAQALSHIADQDLSLYNTNGTQAGSRYGGGTDLNGETSFSMLCFFRNAWIYINLNHIGINPATLNEDELEAVMNTIYVPTAADDAALAVPAGVDVRTVQHNIQTKTSFGVCPYVAMKLGYYFREIRGCLFAKLGLIHLNGHVIPVNSAYGIQEEKFHKIAPFVAVELMKNINEKWGWAVEISHAFRTKKKMKDVHLFGMKVENSTSISRTNVRLMAMYRF